MADALARRRPVLRIVVILGLALLVGLAVAFHQYQSAENAKNFEVKYKLPSGWKAVQHGPETLFREQNPKNGLILRGAVNQVIDAANPTPELDTAGMARYYEDRTHENMPSWTATELGNAPGDGIQFAVLRRSTKDRVVITAYSVRGNTTVLMTLFGEGKAKSFVDPNMPVLYDFLRTVSLHEKDMSNL